MHIPRVPGVTIVDVLQQLFRGVTAQQFDHTRFDNGLAEADGVPTETPADGQPDRQPNDGSTVPPLDQPEGQDLEIDLNVDDELDLDDDPIWWDLRAPFDDHGRSLLDPASTELDSDEMDKRFLAVEEAAFDLGSMIQLPKSPYDIFAFSAYLLALSGCYHHVLPVPDRHGREASDADLKALRNEQPRVLWVSRNEREQVRKLAQALGRDPKLVQDDEKEAQEAAIATASWWWWQLIGVHGDEPVYCELSTTDPPPEWWLIALRLMMLSDELARDAGFNFTLTKNATVPWFIRPKLEEFRQRTKQQKAPEDVFANSFSLANQDVVCVVPKSRTTPVGCTLRSLSHNIALLPPRGIARARWIPRYFDDPPAEPLSNQFNLLLVPYPFSIKDQDFSVEPRYEASGQGSGFFHCKQSWLDPAQDLMQFIQELANDAISKGADRIDAVVLPELALDYKTFEALRELLKRTLPELRLFIAGLSDNHFGQVGNFVGVVTFLESNDPTFDEREPPHLQTVRDKHHRWQLDRAQIEAYGLEGVLDIRRRWWENIDLLSRRVDFTVFHENSVLAAMICEDLARVDPCQELLRSVGPSLVIALLMDAPQIETRWPARYATILAEDPGCSVLTLTSRGLVARQRWLNLLPELRIPFDEKPAIALWRDDTGRVRQIKCGFESHGVWLKLHGMNATDLTLDGRSDNRVLSWIWAKDRELCVSGVDHKYPRIVGVADREIRARMKCASHSH